MRIVRTIIALSFFVALFGCAAGSTGSFIVTGKVRLAISPIEVKIYLDPPSQYETIGIVEASSNIESSSQAAQDRVINELKAQAAKIGANGVLLINTGDKSGELVGFYSGGIFYASAIKTKTAKGKAIFVTQE